MTVAEDSLGKKERTDYYFAKMEKGELVMEPHCACGNLLLEEYFCKKCSRQCRCTEIICDDETALEFVKNLIATSPQFRNFKACKKD
jgi:hypothetical protein